jgi:hypothetical protein
MSALDDKLSQWRRETDVDPSPALMAELAALAAAPPAPSSTRGRWPLAKTALVAGAVVLVGLIGWLISPGLGSESSMKSPPPGEAAPHAHLPPGFPVAGPVPTQPAPPNPVVVAPVPTDATPLASAPPNPAVAAPVPTDATPLPPTGKTAAPGRARGVLVPADATPLPTGEPAAPRRARGVLAPADATPLPTGEPAAPRRARGALVPVATDGSQLLELVAQPRSDGGSRP